MQVSQWDHRPPVRIVLALSRDLRQPGLIMKQRAGPSRLSFTVASCFRPISARPAHLALAFGIDRKCAEAAVKSVRFSPSEASPENPCVAGSIPALPISPIHQSAGLVAGFFVTVTPSTFA